MFAENNINILQFIILRNLRALMLKFNQSVFEKQQTKELLLKTIEISLINYIVMGDSEGCEICF